MVSYRGWAMASKRGASTKSRRQTSKRGSKAKRQPINYSKLSKRTSLAKYCERKKGGQPGMPCCPVCVGLRLRFVSDRISRFPPCGGSTKGSSRLIKSSGGAQSRVSSTGWLVKQRKQTRPDGLVPRARASESFLLYYIYYK